MQRTALKPAAHCQAPRSLLPFSPRVALHLVAMQSAPRCRTAHCHATCYPAVRCPTSSTAQPRCSIDRTLLLDSFVLRRDQVVLGAKRVIKSGDLDLLRPLLPPKLHRSNSAFGSVMVRGDKSAKGRNLPGGKRRLLYIASTDGSEAVKTDLNSFEIAD